MSYIFNITKIQIMGILNVTPDSFYDGGAYGSPEAALARAMEMQAEGADILDIGAQSTRPGSTPLSAGEELERLLPALELILRRVSIPVSVDTYHPETARQALAHGARIINDVSGVVSEEMARTVKDHGAGWILMHNAGGADAVPEYQPDVVTVVEKALWDMTEQALAFGLQQTQLCVDPGIGFGKTREDDLALLAHTARLRISGVAYLVGASRKRVTAMAGEGDRLSGTIAAHTAAQLGGATILRAHDVKEARQAANIVNLISGKTSRSLDNSRKSM